MSLFCIIIIIVIILAVIVSEEGKKAFIIIIIFLNVVTILELLCSMNVIYSSKDDLSVLSLDVKKQVIYHKIAHREIYLLSYISSS